MTVIDRATGTLLTEMQVENPGELSTLLQVAVEYCAEYIEGCMTIAVLPNGEVMAWDVREALA